MRSDDDDDNESTCLDEMNLLLDERGVLMEL
jgi:hypothetical protein